MKRKLLLLALALAMAFMLCACGQASNIKLNTNHSAQEGQKKLASVENCHLVLRFTINPKLELYLDEAGTVLKATGENKDGKRLLEELELTGLSYADAVNAILSGAAEQELLKENANVQIDVLASADGPLAYEQTQQLQQAVTDYDEDLASSVDQSTVVAANCGADIIEIEESDNGDVWYSYYSSMKLIREILYAADGSYTEWEYQPWGISSLTTDVIDIDPDGTRSEEHSAYEDGIQTYHQTMIQQGDYSQTEESWYEDGCLTHNILQNSDGYYEERTYYSNGNVKTQKNSWADGSYGESTFYANGNQETEQYTGADGTVQERTYYENGECAFSKDVFSDGRVQEQSYYENGVCAVSKNVYPDGASCLEEYNADGNRTYLMKTYANGDWEKEDYYPNGSPQTREGSVGGEYYIIHYDEDGQIIE